MDEEEGPTNTNPELVTNFISTALEFVQQYGWFIVIGVGIVVYLYNRYRPQLEQWQEQREAASYKKMDAGAAQSRLEQMERARQRMQDQLDAQAREFQEKQQQREEEKRQARLEDWERHQQGKGYRSKIKPQGQQAPTPPATSSAKPKPKKTLRGEYNPLMGDTSGGVCYRAPRRGGAAGGG